MQEPVDERRPPFLADDLRAEDRVAQLARDTVGQLLAAVDREREDVGRLVLPEMLAFQRAHLARADEEQPEIAVVDALGPEHPTSQVLGRLLIDERAASILDLDCHQSVTSDAACRSPPRACGTPPRCAEPTCAR